MLEISLFVTMVFLLVAIVTSYLLRDAIAQSDTVDSGSIEKTQLLALGLKPIASVKAGFILPWKKLPSSGELSTLCKVYLFVTRTAFIFAALSILLGVIFEIW